MTNARLHHVSVTCADIDRSIAFYRDVLGLPYLGRGTSDGPEMSTITGLPEVRLLWAEFDLGSGQLLEVLQYVSPRGAPLAQRTNDPGSGHIGIEVDDVDAVHENALARGATVRSEPVAISEEGAWNGVRSMYVVDPDGVTIEVVQRPGVPRIFVVPEIEERPADR